MVTKVYEVYCEPTPEPEYGENFSLFVACKREPTKEELEELLKNRLEGYHVCWVTDDITWDLEDLEIIPLELPEKDTPKDISRTKLREYLINFTKEDYELIEHGVMEDLDNVREFIHYLREGDSDITGKAFDDTVDKIISYILS